MRLVVFFLFAGLCVAAFGKHVVREVEDEDSFNLEESEEVDEIPQSKVAHSKKAESSVVTRVLADVAKLEPEIKATHNKEISSNFNKIKSDATELKSAKGVRASHLREAINDRVKALKLQLEEVDAPQKLEEDEDEVEGDEASVAEKDGDNEDEINEDASNDADEAALEEEEEEKVAKVESDVAAVRAEISKAKISASLRDETMANLDKIVEDAKRYASSKDLNVKKALNLRMQALEEELAPKHKAAPKASSVDKVAKVKSDVSEIRSHLSEAHLSKKAKKEVLQNLESIETDAERMSKASPSAAKKLTKAINLRMKALEEQMA